VTFKRERKGQEEKESCLATGTKFVTEKNIFTVLKVFGLCPLVLLIKVGKIQGRALGSEKGKDIGMETVGCGGEGGSSEPWLSFEVFLIWGSAFERKEIEYNESTFLS
jgi:hypothetical protein